MATRYRRVPLSYFEQQSIDGGRWTLVPPSHGHGGSGGGGGGGTGNHMLTEGSDFLATEGGDEFITET